MAKTSSNHKRLSKEQCEYIYMKLRTIMQEKVSEILNKHRKSSGEQIEIDHGGPRNGLFIVSVTPVLSKCHYDFAKVAKHAYARTSARSAKNGAAHSSSCIRFKEPEAERYNDTWMLNAKGLAVVKRASEKAAAIHDLVRADLDEFFAFYEKVESEAILGSHETNNLFATLSSFKVTSCHLKTQR
jgi:hypothetical protein